MNAEGTVTEEASRTVLVVSRRSLAPSSGRGLNSTPADVTRALNKGL